MLVVMTMFPWHRPTFPPCPLLVQELNVLKHLQAPRLIRLTWGYGTREVLCNGVKGTVVIHGTLIREQPDLRWYDLVVCLTAH